MDRRYFVIGISCSAGFTSRLRAEDEHWPARTLRILVPGGTGGVIDIRARWIAQRLSSRLQQGVVVENRPGAGGNLGTEIGARSAPDGYTLTIIHQGTMTVNPHLYPRPGYNALTDFAPITRLGVGPLLLTVHPSLPAGSLKELVQIARDQPGRLSYCSPGIGTPPHLAAEIFKRTTGIDVVHVPYKGGGQAASDLVAGHVQFTIENMNVQLPYVNAGRLRPLAVTGGKRVMTLPEVPTVAEAGWPSYEFEGWVGIAAPALTPRHIVDRVYQEIHAILDTEEARDWFGTVGAEPGDVPPARFEEAIRAEYAKWAEVIRDAGIRLES
jgi:tripartite-type tricarboxylate transporter receptor subunit TctC